MQTDQHIAIIGAGAVGGYYGSLLQLCGQNVHFLLHNDFDHVKQHGLIVESPRGNFKLPHVSAFNSPKSMPPCDLVIVALKTIDNALLPSILPYVCTKDSLVLILQNGLGSEESVSACFDAGRILSGLCFLCSNKVGPGHIRHMDYGLITLGDYRYDGLPAGITPRLKEIGSVMRSAGIPIQTVEDLHHARWKKLIWNIPFNGLTVTHNTLTDQLLKHSATRRLCRTLMEEVAAAAASCARPIDKGFIDKMIADTERMTPYAPSMKLDFDQGRPMEVEAIYGNPVRAAKSAGTAMPATEDLYNQLKELNPAN
jgi:2-dehydropantoate 2-reductase